MKTAVVDSRLSHDAGKADWWIPVRPEKHGALAMAMIRWILENRCYDQRYLENANKAAARADGEPTWTNASHLVKIINGHPKELLRADEAGIGEGNQFVVSRNGKLYAVELKDSKNPVEGDLLVETEVNEIAVKSAFKLLLEQAFALFMEEYAKECGVEMRTIIEVARELTSHGKRAVVEMYRGPAQQTDGYYSGCLIITLNILIGNADYKGGLIKGGGHWHESAGKVRQPVAKPFTEEVEIGGERMPICMETFMIAVARKLNLSGFGKNAFAPGMDFTRPEDWYLKEVANIAFGDKKGEGVPSSRDCHPLAA